MLTCLPRGPHRIPRVPLGFSVCRKCHISGRHQTLCQSASPENHIKINEWRLMRLFKEVSYL